MSRCYRVIFGSPRAEKNIAKFLRRQPKGVQQRLYDAMKSLADEPRPPHCLQLSLDIELYGYAAEYRLRVGDFRILYDVDDIGKTVVILAVRRRSETTYH